MLFCWFRVKSMFALCFGRSDITMKIISSLFSWHIQAGGVIYLK
ncbi:hypothetical protein HMPREF9086_1153 [Enterobacter hormaechei ATCC 49162]|nr:hypothetical protein HMPREF9086_1153 [Enterobacter hormaechei ATCC 49162]